MIIRGIIPIRPVPSPSINAHNPRIKNINIAPIMIIPLLYHSYLHELQWNCLRILELNIPNNPTLTAFEVVDILEISVEPQVGHFGMFNSVWEITTSLALNSVILTAPPTSSICFLIELASSKEMLVFMSKRLSTTSFPLFKSNPVISRII